MKSALQKLYLQILKSLRSRKTAFLCRRRWKFVLPTARILKDENDGTSQVRL